MYTLSICYKEIGDYTHIDKVYEYNTFADLLEDLKSLLFSTKYNDCDEIVAEKQMGENDPLELFTINMENFRHENK